jgi:hypothetical protein
MTKLHSCVWKSHFAGGNCTLRVKSHSCVWKSHSADGNCTLRVEITLVHVEITLCVWKLDSASRNRTLAYINYGRECHIYTNTCQNYTRVCGNHILRVKSHSAGRNCTLCVDLRLCV